MLWNGYSSPADTSIPRVYSLRGKAAVAVGLSSSGLHDREDRRLTTI